MTSNSHSAKIIRQESKKIIAVAKSEGKLPKMVFWLDKSRISIKENLRECEYPNKCWFPESNLKS